MKQFHWGALMVLCLWTFGARAQQPDPAADTAAAGPLAITSRIGAHLYSASLFGDYLSNGLPIGSGFGANLQSDVAYGGSLAMGWVKTGPRVNASVHYTPSYTGRMRYSNVHSFAQDVNASVSFQFKPKWTLSAGAASALRDLQRGLFSSTQAARLASAPVAFSGLAGALVSGQNGNAQLASILTTPSVVNPASGNILYGNRYLTTGLNAIVSYAHSERFQISAGVTGARSQSLSQQSSIASPQPLLPTTMTAGGHASFMYGLTPRLSLSGTWNGQRSFRYSQASTTYGGNLVHNFLTTLGYVAGTKWLFTFGGGIGLIPSVLRTSTTAATTPAATQNTPGGKRYLANGSVVYKFFSQTLTALGSRNVSNSYGLGGGAVVTGDLAWHWTRPGSGWGTAVDGGYQSLQVQGSQSLKGWRGTASLNRMLSRRLLCAFSYAIMRNTGIYTGVNYALTRSTAQVTLTWSFADQFGPLQ